MTKADIAEILSDQVTPCLGRKQPLIEAEPFDDAEGIGFQPLDRWGDTRFKPYHSRWSEDGHPMTDWRS